MEAQAKGYFQDEIVPVEVQSRKKTHVVSEDDSLVALQGKGFDQSKIRALKPAFDRAEGTITAANASSISDGAAALVLMSQEKCQSLGLKPLARVVGFADAEQEPVKFPTTPALAVKKLLAKTGHSIDQIDAFEINEAFAAVVIANMKVC